MYIYTQDNRMEINVTDTKGGKQQIGGGFTWLIVGISGIFSCIIWMRLAARFGYVNIIIIAMAIQAVGVLIPTMTANPMFIILS